MGYDQLKPCPFCGRIPKLYGRKRRDYVDGVWAEVEGEEYWIAPQCVPSCFLGNVHVHAYGFCTNGLKYDTPENAIKAWNIRKKFDMMDVSTLKGGE